MTDVKPQRLEYVEQTRRSLLQAAERLYTSKGYNATSIDAVAAEARFTKGAVYRHFTDKQALFTAVFEQVESDTMASLEARLGDAAVSWGAAAGALAGFLDACVEERYRRIVLEEGPTVLGWARWRELDQQYTGHVLVQVLSGLMDSGLIVREPADLLARLCCATIAEAALSIAQADDDDRDAIKTRALHTMLRMLSGLRATSESPAL